MADVSKLRANINGVFETFGVKDKIARENAENLSNVLSAAQIVDSASGAIASFSDGADDIPVRSLSVDLEPIQDLHGYDYPWPAGGGKNKFNPSNLSQIYYNSAGNQLDNSHWVMSDYIAVTPGVAYTFSVDQTIYSLQIIEFDASKNWIKNNSGGNKTNRTITLDSNTAFVRCGMDQDNTTDMDISTAVETYHPQLEEGSTATAYSPYENLCPISGRTEVTVERTGKNIFNAYNWDIDSDAASILVVDGINAMTVATAPYLECKNRYIFPNALSSYTVRFHIETMKSASSGLSFSLSGVKKDGTIKALKRIICGAVGTTADIDAAIPSEYVGIVFGNWAYSGRVKVTNIQIEISSTASDYEPYDGQSVTIDIGQTVYGGTAEIISGQGESGFMRYVLTGNEVWKGTSDNYRYADIPELLNVVASPPNIDTVTTARCEFAKASTYNKIYAGTDTGFAISKQTSTVSGRLVISKSIYDVIGTLTGKAFVFPLAEPTALTLTPASLSTLKGQNNVWSDADSVSVEYVADPKLYIDKKIAEALSP